MIDLSVVVYGDSAGINLLFDLDQRLRLRQQRLALVIPATARVREILRISHGALGDPRRRVRVEAAAAVKGSDAEVTETDSASRS